MDNMDPTILQPSRENSKNRKKLRNDESKAVGLPRWTIVAVAVGILATCLIVLFGLVLWMGRASLNGKDLATAQLDAVKTSLSVAVAGGGLFALHLAIRRQRTTEEELQQRDRIQQHAEVDAAERRITEIYSKAVEQIGSTNAAVRIGGLYALERVAQGHPIHRQTVTSVICAYLRMPFEPQKKYLDKEELSADEEIRHRELLQEDQVRITAQRILHHHLQPKLKDAYWGIVNIDLTYAHLGSVNFTEADLSGADFSYANLELAKFNKANLSGVDFTRANMRLSYLSGADLREAVFVLSDVSAAKLVGADLSNTRIIDSRFERSDFTGAKLIQARFPDVSLIGADLSTAHLAGADLSKSLWDDTTKWPVHLIELIKPKSFMETRIKRLKPNAFRVGDNCKIPLDDKTSA